MVSATLAIGAAAVVSFVAAAPAASAASPGPAWTCDAFGYLFQSPNGQDTPHEIIPIDLATGQEVPGKVVDTADTVNAAAYNTTDNYMYGWDLSTGNQGLVQVGADGTLTHISVSGLPTGIAFNSGDFDSDGHYWMMFGGGTVDSGTWAEIDLAKNSPTYGTVLAQGKFNIPATVQNLGADWGYVNGALYSAGQPNVQSPTTNSHLLKFDTTTHTMTDLGPIPGLPSQTQDVTPGTWTNTAFGAAYVDAAGHVYFGDNNSGDIFRVDVSSLQATDVAAGPQSKQNDGARCATAPIPTITVTKKVAGRVASSDQFTVGLTGPDNTGQPVLLVSATTTGADTSVSTTDWPASQGKDYTITDAMASGSPDTLSAYTPTIACTDVSGDTVTPTGSAPSWTLTVADATNYTCTITNTPGPPSPPWTCSAFGYLFQSPNGLDPDHTITAVDLASGQTSPDGTSADEVNAVGYNTLDNYIYGWDYNTSTVSRVGSDGTVMPINVTGITNGTIFQVGDFDDAGHLWLLYGGTGDGAWDEVDLAPGSPTYGTVLDSGTTTPPATVGVLPSDWTYVNGAFYGAVAPTTGLAHLLKFDPSTGATTDLGTLAGTDAEGRIYGAAYADAAGNLYFSNNDSGHIYRVNPTTRQTILVADDGPKSQNNDGARCATAPIPTITVTKKVAGRVASSDQFTVGLDDSTGTTLTSATTTGTETTVSTTDWPVSANSDYTITDAMASGSPDALSAYTATIACTDASGDTVTPTGSAPSWTLTVADATNYTCTITNTPAPPGPAWTCSTYGYLFQSPGDGTHTITAVDLASGQTSSAGTTADNINAVAYNTLDNYMYGYDVTTSHLVKIAADGSETQINLPTGFAPNPYNVGDFDDAGHLWIADTNVSPSPWAEIDFAPGSATYGQLLDSGTVDQPAGLGTVNDWGYVNGFFYGVAATADHTGDAHLVRFNPANGNLVDLGALPGVPSSVPQGNAGYGAAYVDAAGHLYVAENRSGGIYRVDITTNQATKVATGPASSNNDGARCANAPIPTITVTKDVAGRADSSDQFTVGLTGPDENGQQVLLTSATTTGTDTTVSTTDWPVSASSDYTITDAMAAGSVSTLADYTATISCVDSTSGDSVATTGFGPSWGVTSSEGDPIACTVTNTPEPAKITVSKSVDPASGTTVNAGDVLSYTLTFANSGASAGSTDEIDDLSKALDDATVTSDPTASNTNLTVGAISNGQFEVTGTIPGHTTYTVTYQLTVKPDGQRGDDSVDNFVIPPNFPPPPDCQPGDPTCTHNPVPDIVPSKSVDPASTTPVKAGQVLTYTLSFHNKGTAAGSLSYVDHLADVLDDATITSDPAASNTDITVGALTKDGDLPITGTVPAGATYTVTYQVTVKPDGQRGNDRAANFLTKPGQTPPDKCQPGDALCTVNPMPDMHDWKTVTPDSGTPVVPGQVLTYTLHFTNKGTADGSVDKVDDISQAVDDATVVSQPKSSDPALTATTFGSDHRAHVTGTLKPGQKVTVTYQLKVSDPDTGDGVAANFLLIPGDPPPTKPDCTPTDTQEPDCTSNPIGSLKVSKTADPGSETEVHPGDTITYTLHFTNVGKAAVAVDEIDHLAGVLDDADVVSQPTASSDALSVSAISNKQFEVTGSLAAGESATVTYQVKTKPYDQQGDHDLGNFLDPPGVTPPAGCVTGDPMCTDHRVPPPASPAPSGGGSGPLAFTGADMQLQLILAGLLLAAGGLLTVGFRRRRRSTS